MIIVRRVLQGCFILIEVVLIAILVISPAPNFESILPLIFIVIFIIMVLGPWWPKNMSINELKSSIAAPVCMAILGIYSLYEKGTDLFYEKASQYRPYAKPKN